MTNSDSVLSPVQRISVYCPVSALTFAALVRGEFEAARQDPASAPLLKIIEQSSELGNFGTYRGVYEVGLGFETFTPTAAAHPVFGAAGTRSVTPMITITTFVPADVSEMRLTALVADLAAAHPWEVPVIDVAVVRRASRRC